MSFDEHSADVRNSWMIRPPRGAEAYRAWTASRAAEVRPPERFQLAVESLAGQVPVGGISIGETDERAGWFTYGVAIGHDHQRRGYATEAVVLLLRYMFGERRYHKCEVRIYAFNAASLELHRRLGFVEEGRLREHEFFAGAHHDVVLMGMTADEYAARHPYVTL